MKKKLLLLLTLSLFLGSDNFLYTVKATDEIEEISEVEEADQIVEEPINEENPELTTEDYQDAAVQDIDVDDVNLDEIYQDVLQEEYPQQEMVEQQQQQQQQPVDDGAAYPTTREIDLTEIQMGMSDGERKFNNTVYVGMGTTKFEAIYSSASPRPTIAFIDPYGQTLIAGQSEFQDQIVLRDNYTVNGYPDLKFCTIYLKDVQTPGNWEFYYSIDARTNETFFVQSLTPDNWLNLAQDYKTEPLTILTWGIDEVRSKYTSADILSIIAGEPEPASAYLNPNPDPIEEEPEKPSPFKNLAVIVVIVIILIAGGVAFYMHRSSKQKNINKEKTVKRYNARMKKRQQIEESRLDNHLDKYSDDYSDDDDSDEIVKFYDDDDDGEEELEEIKPPTTKKANVKKEAPKQAAQVKPVKKEIIKQSEIKKEGKEAVPPAAKGPSSSQKPSTQEVKPPMSAAPKPGISKNSVLKPAASAKLAPDMQTTELILDDDDDEEINEYLAPAKPQAAKAQLGSPRTEKPNIQDIEIKLHTDDDSNRMAMEQEAEISKKYEERKLSDEKRRLEQQDALNSPHGRIAKEVIGDDTKETLQSSDTIADKIDGQADEKPVKTDPTRRFDYTNKDKNKPIWMDRRNSIKPDDPEWKKKAILNDIKERPYF